MTFLTSTALNGAPAYAKDAWIIIPNAEQATYSGTILAAGQTHVDTVESIIYRKHSAISLKENGLNTIFVFRNRQHLWH